MCHKVRASTATGSNPSQQRQIPKLHPSLVKLIHAALSQGRPERARDCVHRKIYVCKFPQMLSDVCPRGAENYSRHEAAHAGGGMWQGF